MFRLADMEGGEGSRGGEDNPKRKFPMGFKFKPTDEELVEYYLLPMLQGKPTVPNDAIIEADVYECDPEILINQRYKDRGEDDNWYFLSPRTRKYPNGDRPSRRTADDRGRWKPSMGKSDNKEAAAEPEAEELCSGGTFKFCVNKLAYHAGPPDDEKKTKWLMKEFTVPEYEIKFGGGGGSMMLDRYSISKIYISPLTKWRTDEGGDTTTAREEEAGSASNPGPAPESGQGTSEPTPTNKQAGSSSVPGPAPDSGQGTSEPTPTNKQAGSSSVPGPAPESGQGTSAPTPTNKQAGSSSVPGPAPESGQGASASTLSNNQAGKKPAVKLQPLRRATAKKRPRQLTLAPGGPPAPMNGNGSGGVGAPLGVGAAGYYFVPGQQAQMPWPPVTGNRLQGAVHLSPQMYQHNGRPAAAPYHGQGQAPVQGLAGSTLRHSVSARNSLGRTMMMRPPQPHSSFGQRMMRPQNGLSLAAGQTLPPPSAPQPRWTDVDMNDPYSQRVISQLLDALKAPEARHLLSEPCAAQQQCPTAASNLPPTPQQQQTTFDAGANHPARGDATVPHPGRAGQQHQQQHQQQQSSSAIATLRERSWRHGGTSRGDTGI